MNERECWERLDGWPWQLIYGNDNQIKCARIYCGVVQTTFK